MYMSMFDYFKKNSIYNALTILIVNLAMCFMSANGIVIGAVMIGCFAVVYSILQRKWYTLLLLLFTYPNVVLYQLYMELLRIGG